jgi:hypothetical protein
VISEPKLWSPIASLIAIIVLAIASVLALVIETEQSLAWFSVAAIGGILFFLYQLARWYLRPQLSIDSQKLRLGRTERLEWTFANGAFANGAGLVKEISIHLVGREIATETGSSTNKTYRNTFANIVLAEADVSKGKISGEHEIPIRLSLPSFRSGHNQVVWSIKVFVHLRQWFKLTYDFDVTCWPPAPVETFEPLPSYSRSTIQINEGRVNFKPGEWVTGQVTMDGEWLQSVIDKQGEHDAELQLLWFTRGKGDQDSQVVQRQPIPAGQTTQFRFELPQQAHPSFSGRLVSLNWKLSLVAQPKGIGGMMKPFFKGEEWEQVRLIVSPTGEEFTVS